MEVKSNIKCKNCGADMVFDPQTGKIFCRSCDKKQWFYKDYKRDLKPVKERDISEIKEKAVHHDWMLEEPKYKYLFIPVWLSEFEYKGVTYEIIINGETGKVAGELPVSNRNRNIATILIILAVLFALRYVKEILIIAFAIILAIGIGAAALIWYVRKRLRS